MRVELFSQRGNWDAFVANSSGASNYHRWAWKEAIEETYGHECFYLAAIHEAEIVGILPLVFLQSRVFGKQLVSMPFCSYGGVLTDSSEARVALLAKAVEVAQKVGARHIELRQSLETPIQWQDETPKVTVEVILPSTIEELWNQWSSKLRKRVRYARKHGLQCEWKDAESIGTFYEIFATNMRNLGTPVYPRTWFENLCKHFRDDIHILNVLHNNRPVASAFVIAHRDMLELPWAASLPESRDSFSPLLMYSAILELGVEKGYRSVDLGRCTPGSGNHQFKQHWHGTDRALHWYYWLAPGVSVPALRPDNPRFRWATRLWKHIPLPVANWLGPQIVRSIP